MNEKDKYSLEQQLRLDFEEYTTDKPPNVQFLKKIGIKPSEIYNSFWEYAVERQKIFELRRLGCPYPWTNNSILLKYKFTNTYRASDRVSQYLINKVIYPSKCAVDFSPEDVFLELYCLNYSIESKHGNILKKS